MIPRMNMFFRILPTEELDYKYIKIDRTNNKIYVRQLQDVSKNIILSKQERYWEFQCNGIFLNCKQFDLYTKVLNGVLEEAMSGSNVIIFMFGQSGSGKTYTSSGLNLTEEDFGMLPRIAIDLMELKKAQPNEIKTQIQMSYGEFFNNYAIDLLQESDKSIESCKVHNISKVNISNKYDALKCIFIAEGRKHYVEVNKYLSNLATSVATFHIIRKNMSLSDPTKTYSRLHVVDLVGPPNVKKLNSQSKAHICLANTTKSQLEQFLLSLFTNVPETVRLKQRTNALIYYLNGDFSKNAILRFLGHIKITTDDLEITLSMLKFGNLIQQLKMKKGPLAVSMNEELQLAYYKQKLKELEKEKYLDSVILNQDLVSGMNCDREAHLNSLITSYLTNNIKEIPLLNLADAKSVLQHIKEICLKQKADLKQYETEVEINRQSNTSLMQRPSKEGSLSMTGKSRKSSRTVSKDSLKGTKKTASNGDRHPHTSSTDVAAPIETAQKRKKTSKSSTTFKSSQTKRKSSNTSVDKRDSKTSIDMNLPIPDLVPEKEDIWKRFITTSAYKEKIEEHKLNEKDVKNTYQMYLKAVKQLQIYRDAMNKPEQDFISAEAFRRFRNNDQYNDNGELILSDAEIICKEHLDMSKVALVEQQEKVLFYQELLKINLENRRNILKRTEEDFDEYCMSNYQIPCIDPEIVQFELDAFTFDVDLEEPILEDQEKEFIVIPDLPNNEEILRKFQEMMRRERKLKKASLKKNIQWKNV